MKNKFILPLQGESKRKRVTPAIAMLLAMALFGTSLSGCATVEAGKTDQMSGGMAETIVANEKDDTDESATGDENTITTEAETKEASVTDKQEMTETEPGNVATEVVTAEPGNATTEVEADTTTEETVVVENPGSVDNTIEELEENIFFDSLVYTGYNIEKHRSDGLMWHYVLASQKRGKGWLSDITYAGGSTGYETTEEGAPDISFFEKKGLVCASYVTYVYFNYLPNVAGIDTADLTKPEKSYSADDWYTAAKDWVEKGYSKTIEFEASLTPAGFIDFEPAEEIPIGSIISFCDAKNKSDHCSHVVIYAGYQNDYHWVYHVGNENGPEFCSVQRMHFGPDPQWPISIITTPDMVLEYLE